MRRALPAFLVLVAVAAVSRCNCERVVILAGPSDSSPHFYPRDGSSHDSSGPDTPTGDSLPDGSSGEFDAGYACGYPGNVKCVDDKSYSVCRDDGDGFAWSGPIECGQNASCAGVECVCAAGSSDCDNRWDNGCETPSDSVAGCRPSRHSAITLDVGEYVVSSIAEPTGDGGFLVAANTQSASVLVKFDPDGRIQWKRRYSDEGPRFNVGSITETVAGGFLLSNRLESPNYAKDPGTLIMLDANGNIRWKKSFFETDPLDIRSTARRAEGGYHVLLSNGVFQIDEAGAVIGKPFKVDNATGAFTPTDDGGYFGVLNETRNEVVTVDEIGREWSAWETYLV
ncbi:MAG: hypothetical protein HY897_03290, partial [Deltaproteobacteria bacterium]|nr:hypothetical protein [Deltaproteobacteria bacterium]